MKQNLESIVQRNLFLAEDVGPLERKVKPSEDSEGGSREESVDEQRKPEEPADEGQLSWNDVFQDIPSTGTAEVYPRLEMAPCACHRWI